VGGCNGSISNYLQDHHVATGEFINLLQTQISQPLSSVANPYGQNLLHFTGLHSVNMKSTIIVMQWPYYINYLS